MTEQDQVEHGLITEEQLDQIWNDHRMGKKMERLWAELVKRGLGAMVMPKYVFTSHMKQILLKFFVQGKVDDHD